MVSYVLVITVAGPFLRKPNYKNRYLWDSNMEFKTVRLIRTTVLVFTWINMVSDVIVQPLRSLALMLCVTHESVRDTGAQHVCVCSHVRTCVGSI